MGQYIAAPLRLFRCQKCVHHKDSGKSQPIFGKCWQNDSDQTEEECHHEIR